MSVATRALRVQEGEGRIVGLLVGLMFVSVAGATIGESGIGALFFERIGADALPLMYLLQAGATFGAMLGLSVLLGRIGARRSYLAVPAGLAVLVVIERAVVATDVAWIYPVLWVTMSLSVLAQGIFLWGTAGAVLDTRQAKRLFPVCAGGGILGAVVGGLATGAIVRVLGAENLLLVWAASLVVSFALCRLALGRPVRSVGRRRAPGRRVSAIRDMAQGLRSVRRSRLLLWMTVAAALFSVLFYSLYLPYAQAASDRFPDADELAGFFGIFWAGVTGVAFLVSMLVANRLFAWAGVAAMVVVLPALYAGAFGILFISSAFATLVAIRFVMGVWLQGVASPAWETLVNVVPDSRRDQTRAFLNGGPTQVGTAIAGLVALVGDRALTPTQFAVIGLVSALVTLGACVGIRRSYTGALLEALRAGRPQVFGSRTAARIPMVVHHDRQAEDVILASTRSADLRERRVAFALLAELPAASAMPAFLDGLADPDPLVRSTAIRGLDPSDPSVRERLLPLARDADPAVAAAACALTLDDAASADRLGALLTTPDDPARLAAVEQLDLAPPEHRARLAEGLLSDRSGAIRAEALEHVASAAPGRALADASSGLRDPDRRVRLAAGRALAAVGAPAIQVVLASLDDPETGDAAIEAVRTIEVDGGVALVQAYVDDATVRALRDRDLAASVPVVTSSSELLRDAVLGSARRSARSALWASTLLRRDRDALHAALESLGEGPAQLATALETVEVAGGRSLVPLLKLWEPGERPPAGSGGDWLERSLTHPDPFVRRCAEHVRTGDAEQGGDPVARSTALSIIDRVLFLRRVPLFADLDPSDLESVAAIAEERGYADGEVVAAQGERGEELHLVVDGAIRVVQEGGGLERELARRTSGDVVGEMALLTKEPRVASLIADGDVRTIRIGQREFESMLRERPDIALGVMRVLAYRVAERVPPPDDDAAHRQP